MVAGIFGEGQQPGHATYCHIKTGWVKISRRIHQEVNYYAGPAKLNHKLLKVILCFYIPDQDNAASHITFAPNPCVLSVILICVSCMVQISPGTAKAKGNAA